MNRDELLRIRDAMTLRGPDGCGVWTSACGRAGLAHRRLAIIDPGPGGAQPMCTDDERLYIAFNGEIYNHAALRQRLRGKGYHFRSTSDTEVLLHLYREYGERMVEHLRGMYAFGLWDQEQRRLFLARDPFGIKPLYVADDGATLRFASSVKALLKGDGVDASRDAAGHVGFLLWGWVPEPYTLYRGVSAVPAGHTMWIDGAGRRGTRAFFSVAEELRTAEERGTPVKASEWPELLGDAIRDTVAHHMVADVPVAVFLSGGQDSATLLSAAKAMTPRTLQTVTLGFEEFRGGEQDETRAAAAAASMHRTDHSTAWISRAEFRAERDRVLECMDQPSIDGLNTYFVSKMAAERGIKVALSGVGGDELFASYPSFRQIPRLVGAFSGRPSLRRAGRALRRVGAPLLKHFTSPKYAGILEYGAEYGDAYLLKRGLFMPWELPSLLGPEMAARGWETLRPLLHLRGTAGGIASPRLKVSALELTWYMRNQLLRDADWAGMAHSLEIRVPFVDVEFFRVLARMCVGSAGPMKTDMSSAIRRPGEPEPTFKKRGFVIPLQEWVTDGSASPRRGRGPRAWARRVHDRFRNDHEILVLTPEAYGGHGGIALYNRDLISSLARSPVVAGTVVIPRLVPSLDFELPERVRFLTEGRGSKTRFLATAMRTLRGNPRFSAILCMHVNLLPVAYLAGLWSKRPVILCIYGIDAWKPNRNMLCNLLARRVHACVSISDVTRRRFERWAGPLSSPVTIIPNAIHGARYGAGDRSPELVERYRLHDRKVILTLGRMVSEERYKGFDEILDLLPTLAQRVPEIVYLLVGDGSDRKRLEARVARLGMEKHVVFTGRVHEATKADHYRLADAYVMPSRGEGFGFVFLEAMACGIPVVASRSDGGREALRDGALGILVNPDDPADIERGVLEALSMPKGVPPGLDQFSLQTFERNWLDLLGTTLAS